MENEPSDGGRTVPEHRAVGRLHAPELSVVPPEKESALVNGGRKPHRPSGGMGPLLLAGGQIEAVQRIVGRRPEKHQSVCGHDVKALVVVPHRGDLRPLDVSIPAGRSRPRRTRCGDRPMHPRRLERGDFEPFGRGPGAALVVSQRGPIRGLPGPGDDRGQQHGSLGPPAAGAYRSEHRAESAPNSPRAGGASLGS